ncbi:MAG TPA: hypothetical protein VLF15_06485 [Pseudoxanthomonas sp.]|nr:hypothetical protein [Pseudoxanthomonas sp.]
MNLPLHLGFLGALEAGIISLLIGMLAYAGWHWLCRVLGWSVGHAIGWACVTAVVISAGIDAWNMFHLGMMKLESPLYARIALHGIHDAGGLGARVVCEFVGALTGVVLGWHMFSVRSARKNDTENN